MRQNIARPENTKNISRSHWTRVAAVILVFTMAAVLSPVAGAQAAAEGSSDVPNVRIKELARLQSVRDNQLTGLGLIVGLDGTGDGRGSQANVQMVANMLERFGLTISSDDLRLRNVAAVMVTATLPPFSETGDAIDVTVSSFGDAKSLQGGFLLQTPLMAADGEVYVVAQGPVSIGGFNVRSGGSQTQRNHAVVGRVSNGGLVERTVPIQLGDGQSLTWVLRSSDFTTASRVADAINERFGEGTAAARDGSAITVEVPVALRTNPVPFVAIVEELTVRPDAIAQVVVNERTGTVVLGQDVRIATVAVSHGSLTVKIDTEAVVSQPRSLSEGETVITRETRIQAEEAEGRLMVLEPGSSVGDLVQALNAIGASPRDVIAILQAIKVAGALYGELVVI